jgi:hypothetical protein
MSKRDGEKPSLFRFAREVPIGEGYRTQTGRHFYVVKRFVASRRGLLWEQTRLAITIAAHF